MFGRGKRNKLRIEKTPAFQIRSSATEIPPHSCGKTSGGFCSRGIRARPGYQMLPRRPSVSLSTAIDESASVHSGLAHRSIRFPIAGSDFCADAKADAKKYTALTIGARFSPGDVLLGNKRFTLPLRVNFRADIFPESDARCFPVANKCSRSTNERRRRTAVCC